MMCGCNLEDLRGRHFGLSLWNRNRARQVWVYIATRTGSFLHIKCTSLCNFNKLKMPPVTTE
ncbi:hypothetical protein PanWU01x14_368040 [Parasponia andersonii]|uniref:Uncharacterized protein n=1 Tax=Parasponia andersonii TaxID=3476 RepID=A0A2P5A539_PARAD|nr:hypothetical protein PanWU01x14_368040 [Parasponia andersonii]